VVYIYISHIAYRIMNNNERSEYLLKIQNTQNDFYKIQTKHKLFKSAQKTDCTNFVNASVRLEPLIECTVFIVPNTNILFFNYIVFKTYGNLENCSPLYTHIVKLVETILSTYESFEFHVNMKSFSVSACQRYSHLICSSVDTNQIFTEKLSKLVVYHTPFIIDQITRMLYNSVKTFIHKAEYVSKDNSEERISQLLTNM